MFNLQYSARPEDAYYANAWLLKKSRSAFSRAARVILLLPWLFAGPLALLARGPAIFLLGSYYVLILVISRMKFRRFVTHSYASLAAVRSEGLYGIAAWLGNYEVNISTRGISSSSNGGSLAIPWEGVACFEANEHGLFLLSAVRGHDLVIIVPARAFKSGQDEAECLALCCTSAPAGANGAMAEPRASGAAGRRTLGPGPWGTWRWQSATVKVWGWLTTMCILAWPHVVTWANIAIRNLLSFMGSVR